jgi:hypothetical protein
MRTDKFNVGYEYCNWVALKVRTYFWVDFKRDEMN